MTFSTIPTLAQVQHIAVVTSEVLGALFTVCTAIGNPLAKYATGRAASWGHLLLAFGADVGKARKRVAELSGSSEE